MKVGAFAKLGTLAGCVAITAGLLVSAPAAQADPSAGTYPLLAGVGSDTTQDVMNAIASAINGSHTDQIASYDALGETTVQMREDGLALPRPNGSGEGYNMLKVATGQLSSASIKSGTSKTALTVNYTGSVDGQYDVAGAVDFARSSSGVTTQNANGAWTFIPFAKDAVGVAANPSDPLTALGSNLTLGSSGDTATTASLYSIYHCLARYVYINDADSTYNSVGATAEAAPAGTTATEIKPLLPAYGSGTRKYFVGKLGYTDASGLISVSNTNTNCISDTYNSTGINEHDGTAIQGVGAGAIGPFSIPQFVAQTNHPEVDRRHDVTLLQLGSLEPIVDGATNPLWDSNLVRKVYNIVPSRLADDANSEIAKTFVGETSYVCEQTAAIEDWGFIPMNGVGSELCGYTGYREGTNLSDGSMKKAVSSLEAEFTQVAPGDTLDVQVNVPADNVLGGTVSVLNAADEVLALGTGTVAIGDNAGIASVTIPADAAVGTMTLKATFTPSFGYFDTSDVSTATVKVKVVNPYEVALTTTAKTNTKINVAIPFTATISAGAGNTYFPGGDVTLYNNDAAVQTVSLDLREKVATFSVKPTVALNNYYVVYEPNYSGTALNATSDNIVIRAAVQAATISTTGKTVFTDQTGYFAKISKASSAAPTITAKIAKVGTSNATGTVKVLLGTAKTGGITLVGATTLAADGTVTLTLPKASKWRVAGTGAVRYLTLVYSGDTKYWGKTLVLKVQVNN
jgi:ABC-type phosphate transport system substrate-binding protein